MANTDAAYGFRPVMVKGGATPATNVYAPQGYSIASAYGSTIAYGDPVGRVGTASADGRPNIQLVSTPGTILGVFAGVHYTDANGEQQFSKSWIASTSATNVVAHVFDDERTIFSIQGSGTISSTDIGAKADYVHATSVNGESRAELDTTTITTGDSLLILGRDDSVEDNTLGIANPKVLVMIREHEFHSTLTAV